MNRELLKRVILTSTRLFAMRRLRRAVTTWILRETMSSRAFVARENQHCNIKSRAIWLKTEQRGTR